MLAFGFVFDISVNLETYVSIPCEL